MSHDRLIHSLRTLAEGRDLSADEVHSALSLVMEDGVPEPLLAALLTGLKVKGETPEELLGAVRAVRGRMTAFPADRTDILDTCGTGGDGANSVNVSTAVAIVVAACGVAVAKHGNRSASGNSGSAEVLAELGVNIEAPVALLARSLNELGITFLFAPRFHPALRFAASVRKQLPYRTIFNLVGPLANPAGPSRQLIGVPNERAARLVAGALAALGTGRAAVVNGADGLDEVTLDGPTRVRFLEDGTIREETWLPEDFGLPAVPIASLRIDGPAHGAGRIRAVLAGRDEAARAVVLANAGAALFVAGKASTLRDGVGLASEAIDSGAASHLLDAWGRLSRSVD